MTKTLITEAVRDYFEGWFDGDLARSAVYREHLHLLRMPEGWRIANAQWRSS